MVRPLLAALVACFAVVAVAAAPASASITLTYTGTTIGIAGAGDNATYLAFDSDGTVTVRNSTGVVNDSSCTAEVVPTLGTYFHCPGAATAVAASYGGGQDLLDFEDVCVPQITASLGDGPGEFQRPDGCPDDQLATVTGGSADDVFNGGAGPDHFDGGGGADRLRGGGGDDVLHGGPGNDPEVFGGDGNDQLSGEDGDDKLRGGAGNDAEDGGAGNDTLGESDADAGADDLRGGPGSDVLDLDAHAGGAAILLDDVANDGTPGEGDDMHSDVEKVIGTRGGDTMAGTAGNDVLDGNFGADVLRGGAGDDNLTGGSDADQLYGEAGNDTLYGGEGDDRVDGGPGIDSLFGDYSACSAYGCSSGNDQLFARDGEPDALNCGAGADSAQIDAIDTLAQDGFQLCEAIDRAVPLPPAPGPTPTPPTPPKTSAPAALQKATATGGRKRLTLTLTLRRASTITITITRVGARKALGKLTIKAKAGKSTRVVRKVGKRTLRAGRYRVVVRVGTTTKTFTVRVR
ncbi:MAG: Hemolysin-type calcium-binding region [Conexibacter sp.]|nr:Hemolysin-type calcium-binding region [Conexibacter sp.]